MDLVVWMNSLQAIAQSFSVEESGQPQGVDWAGPGI